MTKEEFEYVNRFEEKFLTPIRDSLTNHKHRSYDKDPFARTMEEIFYTLNVLTIKHNGFKITFECKGDHIEACFKQKHPTNHIEHCLFELLNYLEFYNAKHCLLPLARQPENLKSGIKSLLQIVNPSEYGEFVFHHI